MATVKTDTTFETYLNELDEKDQETIIRLDQMLTKQFGKVNFGAGPNNKSSVTEKSQ